MSLHLAPPVSTWVGLVVLGAGAAAVLVGTRRLAALGIGRAARPMVALRTVSVLLLLLAFANPTVVSAVPPDRRPRVRLLLDTSSSMTVPDGRRGTRLEDAKRVGREVTALLRERFTVETLAFGAGASPVDGPDRLDGAGTATDLGAALRAANAGGGEPPAAIVLASDGIDTVSSGDPRLTCPVLAVPLGTDLDLVDDVRVVALRAPERADLHTSVAVDVDVAVTGSAAFRTRSSAPSVTLLRGPQTVETKTATLDEGGRGTVRFDVRLDDAGIHALEARVGPVPKDLVPSDDRRRVFVLAEDPSLRVLVLAARVTREYRPLKAEISRTPGVRFAAVLRLAPGRVLTDGVPAGDPLASGFPSDPAALARFDVVVLVATPAKDLAPAEEAALVAFVEGGGGLFVVGDEDALGLGGWAGRPLARLLPVEVRGGDEEMLTGAFRAEAGTDGRASPILDGLLEAIGGTDGGAGLVLGSLHRAGAPRPGAQTLLETHLPDGPPRPLLVTGVASRGRALVWLTNTLHRVQAGNPAAYGALVRQGLRWLAARSAERETLSLSTDRPRYARDATARVTAVTRGADRAPRADAALEARRLGLDGKDAGPVAFLPVDGTPGSFLAEVHLAGDEPIRVRVTASVPGAPPAIREVLLRAEGDLREGEQAVADPARLAAIASGSGGAVVPSSALDEIPARLAAVAPEGPRDRERSLAFDAPWLLVALASSLLAEWILRRRQNLP